MRAMMTSWRMETLPRTTQKVTSTAAAAYSAYRKVTMLTLMTVSPGPSSDQQWRNPETGMK